MGPKSSKVGPKYGRLSSAAISICRTSVASFKAVTLQAFSIVAAMILQIRARPCRGNKEIYGHEYFVVLSGLGPWSKALVASNLDPREVHMDPKIHWGPYWPFWEFKLLDPSEGPLGTLHGAVPGTRT